MHEGRYTRHIVKKQNSVVSSFTTEFEYPSPKGAVHVAFSMWKSGDAKTIPDTILFLGVGQTGRIPKWLAAELPPEVMVVEGIPYWHAGSSSEELEKFTCNYVAHAAAYIQQKFGVSSCNIIGHSQAAYGAVQLCLMKPEFVQNVGLLFPLGLNTHHLGRSETERWKTLKKRSFRSMLQWEQTPFHDARNIYAGYRLLHSIRADKGSFKDKFVAGVSYDLLPDVERLSEALRLSGGSLSLGLAGNDKLFAAHEIRDTLQRLDPLNLTILELPQASHGSIAKKSHQTFIREFAENVRQSL